MTASAITSTSQRTPSISSRSADSNCNNNNSNGSIRKRVCKACDRCRLKKSKCDGASPCSRCKLDNAICVFGERKKSHDKVYPKGYVEMLEQQQSQLVAGIRELYRRLCTGDGWPGAWLEESNVADSAAVITESTNRATHPLTHDILERLDLLHVRCGEDGSPINGNVGSTFLQQQFDGFDENCARLQQRLIREGASMVERRRVSQPQQKKQQRCQDRGEGQHRRKRLRTDSSHFGICSDDDREMDSDNNECEQDEDEGGVEDENEIGDEPALVDTRTVTPRSTSLSASPESLAIQSLDQEKYQTGRTQQPQSLQFFNPFSEKSLPPTPPPIPTLQLTRSSSSASGGGVNNENSTAVSYQRHQSLPFLNHIQSFSNINTSPMNRENNLSVTSALKPHSPYRAGMNTIETVRTSWATSSAAVTAAKPSLPSSERHHGANDSKHNDVPTNSLHHKNSSATAITRLSTAAVTTTAGKNQLLPGKGDSNNKAYEGSTPVFQSALSPTASLSTAQHSVPSPLTPLTPPISTLRTNSADIATTGTKNTNNSSMGPVSALTGRSAMTLTPSLIVDLDAVDWQADGKHGLDGFAGLSSLGNLDGMGGFNGFNGLTTLGNAGATNDMDMDLNRFIWT